MSVLLPPAEPIKSMKRLKNASAGAEIESRERALLIISPGKSLGAGGSERAALV